MMNTFLQLRQLLRSQGLYGAGTVVLRKLTGRPAAIWKNFDEQLQGLSGVEIGGPSAIFRNGSLLPIYQKISHLDGINFGNNTMWEGALIDNGAYCYAPDKPPGRQWLREAASLDGIADETYDVLLSSHVIEHVANPFKALKEWNRVLKPNGWLVMVVPHRDGTGDRRRPVTTLEHIQEDFRRGTGEDDQTHFKEIELGDPSLALPLPRDLGIKLTLENNILHRMAHHHVFDSLLAAQMLDATGWNIQGIQAARPFNIIAFARKQQPAQNSHWLSAKADYLTRSPFPSDRARGI